MFIPFSAPAAEQETAFYEWTRKLTKLVPDLIYVHSARNTSLKA
jgi:hypothetical protein